MDNSYPRRLFINSRYNASKQNLQSGLEHLQMNISRALKHLEEGEGLDEHMITNAGQITRDIAIFNLTRDLKAFEDDDSSKTE